MVAFENAITTGFRTDAGFADRELHVFPFFSIGNDFEPVGIADADGATADDHCGEGKSGVAAFGNHFGFKGGVGGHDAGGAVAFFCGANDHAGGVAGGECGKYQDFWHMNRDRIHKGFCSRNGDV